MKTYFSLLPALLVVVIISLPQNSNAGGSAINTGRMFISYPKHSLLRVPLTILVECPEMLSSKQQKYDITLSEGIKLIEGNLHWEHDGKLTQPFKHKLTICFIKRGIHQISLEYDYKHVYSSNPYLKNLGARIYDQFAFVGKDTVVWSMSIEELKHGLRSNRYGTAIQGTYSTKGSTVPRFRHQSILNQKPSMFETITTAEIGFFWTLDQDADTNQWNLFEHFPEFKEDAISQHYLLLSKPELERLPAFFVADWLLDVSPDFEEVMSKRLKQQLNELYLMDHRILSISDSVEFFQAVQNRNDMLIKQLTERKKRISDEKRKNQGIKFDNGNR